MPAFEEVSRETVWRGSFFSVELVRARTADGREVEREVVRHPGAVAIVARDGDEVVLVDEYRLPVGRSLLQIPAGKLDVPGEEPLACAQRELGEELGMAATTWTHLATFTTTPGFCDEWMHLFLAEGLSPVERSPQGLEEEGMDQVRVRLEDAPLLIEQGRIADAKTIIGLLLARERGET